MKRLALLSLCLLIVSHAAHAQWALNGTPVTTAPSDQTNYQAISDGSGGVIVVWMDERGVDINIYAQKLDAYGNPKWAIDGVAVCTAVATQANPALCSDGAGGCIIAWEDARSGSSDDIYAQRITSAGAAQWAANGVVISNAALDQFSPCIVSDGAGGAIVAFQDGHNGNDDIYAQRINGAGAVQWVVNGKSVCIVAGLQQAPVIVSDNANGAVVSWHDFRNGNYDVYAQRMSSAGSPQWTAGGVAVCIATGQQTDIHAAIDGAGGALLAWTDQRSGNADIYVQRVNASGTALWTANGVAVCVDPAPQYMDGVTTDGAGGAIVAWEDSRAGIPNDDIYAGRVAASGVPQWQHNGVPICTDPESQHGVSIDSDGVGGAVMAWTDFRRGPQADIYGQRIAGNGQIVWDVDGDPINDRQDNSDMTVTVWSGGAAIVVWRDTRLGGGQNDIFAQRVDGRFGLWGHPEPNLTSVADVRADEGGHVKVNWKPGTQDGLGFNQVIPTGYYTVWRATDAASAVATSSALVVDDLSRLPANYTGKAFYVQHAAATDYYWELAGTEPAIRVPAYSMSVETRADSVLGNQNTHHFMVVANSSSGYQQWPSNEMAGRSVDNLAPLAPLALVAYRAGSSVVLKWNRVHAPDLRDYSVYRKTSSGVTAIDPDFLDDTEDSTLVDANAPATALYYIVVANDVHANHSAPSHEAAVSSSTGASNMPPITGLMVMQNRPNPFGGRSTFDIGLPASSRVSMDVFDIAGRRVATRSFGTKPAGWQQITLDAMDESGAPLPSGVYFYRIKAAGREVTRKMVIAR